MSDFKFTLDEIMKGDPAVFNREITKQLPDPNTPMKTTASLAGGNEDFLSTLSVGQLLMGMPATNSDSSILAIQDKVFSTVVGASMQDKSNGGTAGALQTKAQDGITTAFDYIVPGDISQDAKNWVANPASQAGTGSGTGVDGSTATSSGVGLPPGLPGTSGTVTNLQFLEQLQTQFGVPYSTVGRFGPSHYDCSGFVYTGLVKIGMKNVPNVSWTQYQWCANAHLNISVAQAVNTPGALLFISNYLGPAHQHVAVSDGQGNMYAARETGTLTGSFPLSLTNSGFDLAGLVPGMHYLPIPGSGGGAPKVITK